MKPVKVQFYVYAESEDEARSLEKDLHGFVDGQYRKGVLVTASKLSDALNLAPVEFPEQCASACGDGTAEEGVDGQEQEA